MKGAIDKNESEFERLRREALAWMERKSITHPFIMFAVKNIQPYIVNVEHNKQQDESKDIQKPDS